MLGTYQPAEGKKDCLDCPAGYYCTNATSNLSPCPPRSFCPLNTHVPLPCPNGTYTYDNDTLLASPSDCRSCITGYYCRAGI